MEQGEQKIPDRQLSDRKKRIGDILLENELVTQEQLDRALIVCKENGKRLGETLINLGFVTEWQIIWVLSRHFNIPLIENLDIGTLDLDLIRSIPQDFLFTHRVLPLAILDDEIAVAMADPTDSKAIKDLENITGRKVRLSIALASHISQVLSHIFVPSKGEYLMGSLDSEFPDIPPTRLDPLIEKNFSGSSFLNFHLTQASFQNADEIHIDPLETALWVRYRVNGVLKHKSVESMGFYEPMIQQLRIIGKLNIQKMAPQGAEAKVRLKDRELHLKFSIFPTLRGHAVWIKILKDLPRAEDYQLARLVTSVIEKFPSRPNGLLLVTSPFLFERNLILSELIKQLDFPERKIIVLEEKPSLPLSRGVHLILSNLSEVSGQKVLEELLSQNPEVLILNQPEIFPDFLTPVLWEAASSNTLIISTLANKDSGEALEGLLQKIKPMLLRLVLRYLLAGTRFKRLCPTCREPYIPSVETSTFLNLHGNTNLCRARGCDKCAFTGIDGELRLYELLEMDRETQALLQHASPANIREAILERMENSIQRQALQKLTEGKLSEEEVIAKIFY